MKKRGNFFRRYHKWLGIIFSFFLLMFCLSGILLNHRKEISPYDISRAYLPKIFRYHNWNNNAITSAIKVGENRVLLYGEMGIWRTDSLYASLSPYMNGIRNGADNQHVKRVAMAPNGDLFAVTNYSLYRLECATDFWHEINMGVEVGSRMCDLAFRADTLVLLTRSHIFYSNLPYDTFRKIEVSPVHGEKSRVSLFRVMWFLHSGKLFGPVGKIVVDLLGVVIMVLVVTGVMMVFFPKLIRRKKGKQTGYAGVGKLKSSYKTTIKWHNHMGVLPFILLLILGISGVFLRPPFLIAIVRVNIPSLPGTVMDGNNPWYDNLRVIRYDKYDDNWLLYTSKGFYVLSSLNAAPVRVSSPPPISVMGVTVLDRYSVDEWIVGSFSGIYRWNSRTKESRDYLTNVPVKQKRGGPPDVTQAVAGFIADYPGSEVVFRYSEGAVPYNTAVAFPEMPSTYENAPMSWWRLALEVHTGRIYIPFLGLFSELFIFFSGLIYIFIVVSGYVVYRKYFKKKRGVSLWWKRRKR